MPHPMEVTARINEILSNIRVRISIKTWDDEPGLVLKIDANETGNIVCFSYEQLAQLSALFGTTDINFRHAHECEHMISDVTPAGRYDQTEILIGRSDHDPELLGRRMDAAPCARCPHACQDHKTGGCYAKDPSGKNGECDCLGFMLKPTVAPAVAQGIRTYDHRGVGNRGIGNQGHQCYQPHELPRLMRCAGCGHSPFSTDTRGNCSRCGANLGGV